MIKHCNDFIMSALASEITSLTIVYSTVYSRRKSKKTSMLRATGLCAGNSPETGEFPAQRASNAENASIWWRHHGKFMSFMVGTFADTWRHDKAEITQMNYTKCWNRLHSNSHCSEIVRIKSSCPATKNIANFYSICPRFTVINTAW